MFEIVENFSSKCVEFIRALGSVNKQRRAQSTGGVVSVKTQSAKKLPKMKKKDIFVHNLTDDERARLILFPNALERYVEKMEKERTVIRRHPAVQIKVPTLTYTSKADPYARSNEEFFEKEFQKALKRYREKQRG